VTASPSEAAGQGVGYCVDGLSSTTCATTAATNPSLTVDLGEEMTAGNVLLDGLNVTTAFPLAVYLGSSSSNPLLNNLCGTFVGSFRHLTLLLRWQTVSCTAGDSWPSWRRDLVVRFPRENCVHSPQVRGFASLGNWEFCVDA